MRLLTPLAIPCVLLSFAKMSTPPPLHRTASSAYFFRRARVAHPGAELRRGKRSRFLCGTGRPRCRRRRRWLRRRSGPAVRGNARRLPEQPGAVGRRLKYLARRPDEAMAVFIVHDEARCFLCRRPAAARKRLWLAPGAIYASSRRLHWCCRVPPPRRRRRHPAGCECENSDPTATAAPVPGNTRSAGPDSEPSSVRCLFHAVIRDGSENVGTMVAERVALSCRVTCRIFFQQTPRQTIKLLPYIRYR